MHALRHPRLRRLALLASLACIGMASATARASTEFTQFELLEFLPANPDPVALEGPLRGILSVPPGWRPGDAAAIVIPDQPVPDATGANLIPALLGEGAAVLELDLHTPRGAAADNAVIPTAYAAVDLLPGTFGALRALRQQAGAGIVVVIGTGIGGEAALLAADRHQAEWHLGPNGPRFAAHAEIALGRLRFSAGLHIPDEREAWPRRAELLCGTLAWAAAAAPTPLVHDAASFATLEEDCRASLRQPSFGEARAAPGGNR